MQLFSRNECAAVSAIAGCQFKFSICRRHCCRTQRIYIFYFVNNNIANMVISCPKDCSKKIPESLNRNMRQSSAQPFIRRYPRPIVWSIPSCDCLTRIASSFTERTMASKWRGTVVDLSSANKLAASCRSRLLPRGGTKRILCCAQRNPRHNFTELSFVSRSTQSWSWSV
jgi:hypothetical protein